jgi:uroporphyrinogen-III synthase
VKVGRIALVGAGTGDPGLLTLRAAEVMRVADVVAYDELIAEAILAMVPARAELLVLGRRSEASARTRGLHPELGTRALLGQNAVQLELGDPLSITRSDEVEALVAAGVGFELVRGVCAANGGAISGVLVGKTIIVARARPGTSELGRRLRDLGATAIELPHVDKGSEPQLSLAVSDPSERGVALLSSVEAVEAWLDSAVQMPIIALGSEVAALLRAAHRPPVLTLRGACLDALQDAGQYLSGRPVFVPIAAGSSTTLCEPLRALGATPTVVSIAGHRSCAPARWPTRVDLVVLPSSLSALALYSEAPPSILKTPAVAIGPRSAQQATRAGALNVRMAARDTLEALVAAGVECLTHPPRPVGGPGFGVDFGVVP